VRVDRRASVRLALHDQVVARRSRGGPRRPWIGTRSVSSAPVRPPACPITAADMQRFTRPS